MASAELGLTLGIAAAVLGIPLLGIAVAVAAGLFGRRRRAHTARPAESASCGRPRTQRGLRAPPRIESLAVEVDRDAVEESPTRYRVITEDGTITVEAYAARRLVDDGWDVHRTGNGLWKRLAMVVAVDELKNVQGIDSIGTTMFLLQSPTLLSRSIPAETYRRFQAGLREVTSFAALVDEHWAEFVYCSPGYRHGVLDEHGERERLLAVTGLLDELLSADQLRAMLTRIYESGERALRGQPELLLVRDGVPLFAAVRWPRRELGDARQATLDWLSGEIGVRCAVVDVRER